jgi:hypothetical protein
MQTYNNQIVMPSGPKIIHIRPSRLSLPQCTDYIRTCSSTLRASRLSPLPPSFRPYSYCEGTDHSLPILGAHRNSFRGRPMSAPPGKGAALSGSGRGTQDWEAPDSPRYLGYSFSFSCPVSFYSSLCQIFLLSPVSSFYFSLCQIFLLSPVASFYSSLMSQIFLLSPVSHFRFSVSSFLRFLEDIFYSFSIFSYNTSL